MKKFILLISFLLILSAVIVYLVEYKMPYKKSEMISFIDFILAKPTKENCESIKLNKRGDVVFDNKVIMLDDKTPLNTKSAKEHNEIKTYLIASKRENLDCREKTFEKDFYYTDLRKKYSGKYKPSETMTFDEYLSKGEIDWEALKLNKHGDVIYKNKVIMLYNDIPLNDESAYTTIEIKTCLAAKKVEPREGCDPSDTANNGTLGCYIDNPDK